MNEIKTQNQAIMTVQNDEPSKLTDYYFNIITGHSVTVQNAITDYFLENNTAVQDNIAHNPLEITLNGFCGEKVYTRKEAEENFDKELAKAKQQANFINAQAKLSALSILVPEASNITRLAKNVYSYVYTSARRYMGIIQKFRNSNNPMNTYTNAPSTFRETRLQAVFRKLRYLSDNNVAMWVNTPYGDFLNMYIQSITMRQDEENFISDIEVTLKQLQFAEVKTDKVDESVMSRYNANARAQVEDGGKAHTRKSALKTDYEAGYVGAFLENR